ncbi:MAG TPA: hypothetical protein VF609_07225 [Flavisolibacter sp.]
MKKVLFLLTVAVCSLLSANAQSENDLVISAGDLKKITLGDNMKVVLISSSDIPKEVRITKLLMDKLQVSVANGAMLLVPNKKLTETVFVVVDKITKVTLGENTSVRSSGFLRSDIDLYVSDGASVNLRTTGRLKAFPIGDTNLEIKSTPISFTVATNIY